MIVGEGKVHSVLAVQWTRGCYQRRGGKHGGAMRTTATTARHADLFGFREGMGFGNVFGSVTVVFHEQPTLSHPSNRPHCTGLYTKK